MFLILTKRRSQLVLEKLISLREDQMQLSNGKIHIPTFINFHFVILVSILFLNSVDK